VTCSPFTNDAPESTQRAARHAAVSLRLGACAACATSGDARSPKGGATRTGKHKPSDTREPTATRNGRGQLQEAVRCQRYQSRCQQVPAQVPAIPKQTTINPDTRSSGPTHSPARPAPCGCDALPTRGEGGGQQCSVLFCTMQAFGLGSA